MVLGRVWHFRGPTRASIAGPLPGPRWRVCIFYANEAKRHSELVEITLQFDYETADRESSEEVGHAQAGGRPLLPSPLDIGRAIDPNVVYGKSTRLYVAS